MDFAMDSAQLLHSIITSRINVELNWIWSCGPRVPHVLCIMIKTLEICQKFLHYLPLLLLLLPTSPFSYLSLPLQLLPSGGRKFSVPKSKKLTVSSSRKVHQKVKSPTGAEKVQGEKEGRRVNFCQNLRTSSYEFPRVGHRETGPHRVTGQGCFWPI